MSQIFPVDGSKITVKCIVAENRWFYVGKTNQDTCPSRSTGFNRYGKFKLLRNNYKK